MGKLTTSYKKAIYDEIVDNLISNTSHYYAFAANPIAHNGVIPPVTDDDYSSKFINDWTMLFGKRLFASEFAPIIKKRIWISDVIYTRYDNSSTTLETDPFYVISNVLDGGYHHIYKCIDNNSQSVSTVDPGSIGTPTQTTTFQTSDNYLWRYICSITAENFDQFSVTGYCPVYANGTIQASALDNSGIDVIVVSNTGYGYETYHSGKIEADPPTSTSLVISANASATPGYYVNNSIYVYKNNDFQILNIIGYTVTGSVKTVQLDGIVNTSLIVAGDTNYTISPRVVIESDSSSIIPKAISVINTYSNSISSIIVKNRGAQISWANAYIVSNPAYGSGANLYAIVAPPGGHGSDPISELYMQGISVSFTFSNTEHGTIPANNIVYNKIGIIKNPYVLNSNLTKGSRYTSNTFNNVLVANTSTSVSLTVGDVVIGSDSNSRGIVTWSNSSVIYLVGDKGFNDVESIKNTNGSVITDISVYSRGNIYAKDICPLYVQNINNVTRSESQPETFKLVIKI